MSYKYLDASALRGMKIKTISQVGYDRIEFDTEDGKRYAMFHDQDCCESVTIHDIKGDLQSLVGFTLQSACEESTSDWPSDVPKKYEADSITWTTYTFETLVDKVTIRWLGESNGYYSESVDFRRI